MKAPVIPHEAARLESLRRYHILDTQAEQSFDDLTALASYVCGTPVAFVSLIDEHRQWMKSSHGSTLRETTRDEAFCAHTIAGPGILVVPDARQDPRFLESPLVNTGARFNFYAGIPLENSEGHRLGALCVLDQTPRNLSPEQQSALAALARQVMAQLELRRVARELATALQDVRALAGLLPICSYCKNIRDDEGYWQAVESFVSVRSAARFSHSICPGCMEKQFPDLPSSPSASPSHDSHTDR